MKTLQASLLPNFRFGNSSTCSYCGDPATGRDHVIPVCYQRVDSEQHFTVNGPFTWACRQCNSRLGDKWFDSFDERCRYVRDTIDRTAAPILWHNYELARLDFPLRTFIRQDNARRSWLRDRADWYESREYWLNLEDLQWVNLANQSFLRSYFASTLGQLKAVLYQLDRD